MRGSAQGLKEKKLAQDNLDKVDKLKPIAEKLGVPLAQLALAWCAACNMEKVIFQCGL